MENMKQSSWMQCHSYQTMTFYTTAVFSNLSHLVFKDNIWNTSKIVICDCSMPHLWWQATFYLVISDFKCYLVCLAYSISPSRLQIYTSSTLLVLLFIDVYISTFSGFELKFFPKFFSSFYCRSFPIQFESILFFTPISKLSIGWSLSSKTSGWPFFGHVKFQRRETWSLFYNTPESFR